MTEKRYHKIVGLAAVIFTLAEINSVPAQAALLNFSFTSDGGNGSFVLDTSIEDIIDSPNFGVFPSAILERTLQGVTLGGATLRTNSIFTGGMDFASYVIPFGEFNNLFLNFKAANVIEARLLINMLSPNPSVYQESFDTNTSSLVIYLDQFRITNLVVAEKNPVTQIPESSSTLGLIALGTLGAASTLKRKLKPKSSEKETTKVS